MHADAMAEDPHTLGARLRDSGPAHRITAPDGSTAWLVTRYQDVAALLADPRLSLSKDNAKPDGGYRGFDLPPALDANLLNMDAPQHTRLRRLASPAFGTRQVAAMRPALEKAAQRLADDMAAAGTDADLVADFATPFAVRVISELLGVPERSRGRFRAWTTGMLGAGASREGMREIVAEMLRFFTVLITDKRVEPGPDMLSALVAARDADDRLTEDELTSLAFLLLFAGFENSANLMASSLYAVMSDPELRRTAQPHDPAAITALVEEVARHESPALLAIRRFPVEDIEVGGVTVPAGETVLLSLASANRDPRRFADPDAVDPARADLARHLSFGQGIHYCIGAPLARLEAHIAVTVILERFPEVRLRPDAAPRWQPSPRVRGLASLPARLW